MTAVDGLLLDFGGPVVVTPFERLRHLERSYRLPPGSLSWRGPFDPAGDPLWRDHQAGRISEREYWRIRAAETLGAAGREGGIKEFFVACYQGPEEDVIRPEAIALVAGARSAGLRVALLSNDTYALHGREWVEALSFVKGVDAFLDASETGVAKPDPRAYTVALDAVGVAAGRALFVDDQPANVAGAEAAGVPAVFFDVTDVAGSFALVAHRLGI